MPAPEKKLLVWGKDREAALVAWLARGAELGLDLRGFDGKVSASAAVGEALKRAAACRCGEPARWTPGASLPKPGEIVTVAGVPWQCVAAGTSAPLPTPPEANPLRALRERAGLSQAEAAARCGMSRGAWANAEKAARATPAMVGRARAGLRTK